MTTITLNLKKGTETQQKQNDCTLKRVDECAVDKVVTIIFSQNDNS